MQETSYSVNILDGWNMVGISVASDISFYDQIFENTINNSLYFFNEDGAYEPSENLQIGVGYWLRFNLQYEANISGNALTLLTIDVIEGWNLISGITYPVLIDMIDDPSNLIIPGTVFKFNGSYIDTDFISPGFGYWVRCSGNGPITFDISE